MSQKIYRTIGLPKVFVRNVLRVLESRLEDAYAHWLTPLFDRVVNDGLLELFPLFDQAGLQLICVTTPVAVDTLLQFLPKYSSLPDSGQDCWHKIRPSSENTMLFSLVYIKCLH